MSRKGYARLQHDHTEQLAGYTKGGSSFDVNDRCTLLSWEGTNEVVAKGHISATDPTTKVHGYKLGLDCYRVAIEEVVVDNAEFYRSAPEFSAMEDALRSTIVWPIKYITTSP